MDFKTLHEDWKTLVPGPFSNTEEDSIYKEYLKLKEQGDIHHHHYAKGDTPDDKKKLEKVAKTKAKEGEAKASGEEKKKLDPVGKEDGDIDNDGDQDKSDKYLAKKRKAISKSIKSRKKTKTESPIKLSGEKEKVQLHKGGGDATNEEVEDKKKKKKPTITIRREKETADSWRKAGKSLGASDLLMRSLGSAGTAVEEVELDEVTVRGKLRDLSQELVTYARKHRGDVDKKYFETLAQITAAGKIPSAQDLDTDTEPRDIVLGMIAKTFPKGIMKKYKGISLDHDLRKDPMKQDDSLEQKRNKGGMYYSRHGEEVEIGEAKEITLKLAMKKIEDGEWEAMQDMKPGSHNEFRNVETNKRMMVMVRENSTFGEVEIKEKFAGWIAIYGGKQLEIKKSEADGIWPAKQLAFKHFKVSKSKQNLVAIKPAHEEVEVAEGIRDFKVGDTVKFANDDSDFLGQTGKITSLSGNGISQKATVKLDKGGKSVTNVLVKVDLIKEEVEIGENFAVLNEALKPRDKAVIDAFYSRKGNLASNLLSVEGGELTKMGMGGQTIAVWKNNKIIVTAVSDVKSTETILNYMKKSIPKLNFDKKSWQEFFEEVEVAEGWKKGKYTIKDENGKILGTYSSGGKAKKVMDDLMQKGDYPELTVSMVEEVEVDEMSTNLLARAARKAEVQGREPNSSGSYGKSNPVERKKRRIQSVKFSNAFAKKYLSKNEEVNTGNNRLGALEKEIDKLHGRTKHMTHLKGKDRDQMRSLSRKRDELLKARSVRGQNEESISEKRSSTGYELYHKDFSSAMQHAYDYAKTKGVIVDPKEIDDKVATGPRKPSSGKTNRYTLQAGRKKVEIQVANLDNKSYELNMYIEGVQLGEEYKSRISNNPVVNKLYLMNQAKSIGKERSGPDKEHKISAWEDLAKKMGFSRHEYEEFGDNQGMYESIISQEKGNMVTKTRLKLEKVLENRKKIIEPKESERAGEWGTDKLSDNYKEATPGQQEEVEIDERDEWKNTRIQSKNIFKMLKQKHKNDIPKMKSGLELILKQNKTKPDQEKIMWQEFNKYFKIKEEVEIEEAVSGDIDYMYFRKDNVVKISKKNFSKVHKDYKNSTKGKETINVRDPRSGATITVPVQFAKTRNEEVEIDEAVNLKKLKKEYKKNEDDNYHRENYLLLAKAFGTPAEVKKVEEILKRSESNNSTSKADNDWMYKNINKYYNKFKIKEEVVKEGNVIINARDPYRVFEHLVHYVMGTSIKNIEDYSFYKIEETPHNLRLENKEGALATITLADVQSFYDDQDMAMDEFVEMIKGFGVKELTEKGNSIIGDEGVPAIGKDEIGQGIYTTDPPKTFENIDVYSKYIKANVDMQKKGFVVN